MSSMPSTLLAEIRYAIRGLLRQPSFTGVAVGSLALGIGLNAAVFTVVDGLLYRPLPVDEPSSLVAVFTSEENGEPNGTTSWADFVDLRKTNSVFTDMVGHSLMMGAFGSQGDNRLIIGEVVTANYFDALGIRLPLGHGFPPDADVGEGGHPVTVLSHDLWQRQFDGRRDVIGESVVIHNRPYTVVGVAPADFPGLMPGIRSELWIPASMVDDVEPITLNDVHPSPGNTRLERRGHRWLFVTGRLKPGLTVQAADANLDAIMAGLAEAHPGSNEGRGARVLAASTVRLHPLVDASLRPAGLVLLAAVGLVLLVACANLASMLLARGASRTKELALRLALGAQRVQLVRQLLVENVLVALAGGLGGLVVAWWMLGWLVTLETPFQLEMPLTFAIDLRVLVFTFLLSLLTGLLFGLFPALRSSRANVALDLKTQSPMRRTGGGRFGAGRVLVAGQVAVTVLLVVAGLLMVRSLWAARDVDPGFDPSPIALVSINLGFHGYDEADARLFFDRAVERIERIPGVTAVGLSERMPFSPNVHQTTVVVDGRPDATPPGGLTLDNTRVSPAYFEAMNLPILEGRNFDSRDTGDSVNVAIVNQTLARQLWPDSSAVGKRLRARDESGPLIEVIGVVPDHKVRTLGEPARPFIHFARSQGSAPWGTFVTRVDGNVEPAVQAVSRELRALDRNLVLMEAEPYAQLITLSLLPVRLGATLIGGLAALAMLLAGLGLYGVIAFGVSRRTREIGIRMALGADRRRVVRQVIGEGARLAGVGAAAGFALAAIGSRALGAVLHVGPLDPISYFAAALLLVGTSGIAAGIPARRAASVDPLVSLRDT